jgi:hypothetical protein
MPDEALVECEPLESVREIHRTAFLCAISVISVSLW